MRTIFLGPPVAAQPPQTCPLCGSREILGVLPGRTRGTIRDFDDIIWPPLRACRCGAICETVYPKIEYALRGSLIKSP